MKFQESLFSRIFLAYLPFAVYPYGLFKASVAAAWIVLFFWLTVTFFWFTRRFFPERFIKPAFLLWLIVWAQAVWTLTKLPPFWVLSVYFLTPVSFLDITAKGSRVQVFSKQIPRYFWERLLAGISFVVLVIAFSGVRKICGTYLKASIFDQPAGILLMAFAVAFLWKNLSRGKRS